jgi:DNA-binding transcriptional MocR family regulator
MATRTLDRVGSEPLWQQLQRELLTRLNAGEFRDQFPGELALVEEYGVSRHTVRQALRQLRADGVIVAERGRQPRVAPPPEITQPLGALYSLFASVEAAGLPQHSIVRAFDTRADALVAERLDLEASTPLIYLERLRLAGGEPSPAPRPRPRLAPRIPRHAATASRRRSASWLLSFSIRQDCTPQVRGSLRTRSCGSGVRRPRGK